MHNKRKSRRLATLSPCQVRAVFSQETYTPLRIINHSKGGIMLELDESLVPGEYVDIRFTPDAREATGYWMTSCVGLVKWCARQEGCYGGRFGVGLELTNTLLLQRRLLLI